MSTKKLGHGQMPLDELAHVNSAHDVRTLRGCAVCAHMGNTDTMVDVDDAWFHGRCFVDRFGFAALAALPADKTNRLRLGDLGVVLMQALIGSRQNRRAARKGAQSC